jgi:microcompartment protein CcmK/EutM
MGAHGVSEVGSSRRKAAPVDAAIVGIIDTVTVADDDRLVAATRRSPV